MRHRLAYHRPFVSAEQPENPQRGTMTEEARDDTKLFAQQTLAAADRDRMPAAHEKAMATEAEAEIEQALKLLALARRCNAESTIVKEWLEAANKRFERRHGLPPRRQDAPTWTRHEEAHREFALAAVAVGT